MDETVSRRGVLSSVLAGIAWLVGGLRGTRRQPCDIVTLGREGERDCPEPARYRYQTPTRGPYRFCEKHAAYCATLPLVELT